MLQAAPPQTTNEVLPQLPAGSPLNGHPHQLPSSFPLTCLLSLSLLIVSQKNHSPSLNEFFCLNSYAATCCSNIRDTVSTPRIQDVLPAPYKTRKPTDFISQNTDGVVIIGQPAAVSLRTGGSDIHGFLGECREEADSTLRPAYLRSACSS